MGVEEATRLLHIQGFLSTRGPERSSVSLLERITFSMDNCSFSMDKDSTSGSSGNAGGVEE